MLDETDIQKLLRLKRHEQPPPGYFDTFLQDFHRRQRVELLRQPAWKIAIERLGAFFSDHGTGRLAYASATIAVLLFAGVASFNMLKSDENPSSGAVAVTKTPVVSNHGILVASAQPLQPSAVISMRPQAPLIANQYAASLPEPKNVQVSRPHYVIDSRPVSYERPFSF